MNPGVTPEQYAFFQRNGYLSLGKILSDEQVRLYQSQYDRDRSTFGYLWRQYNHHQSINCDALISWPESDELIRHRTVMAAGEHLIGGPLVFSEICVRHMAPYQGDLQRSWHRDRGHDPNHPLRMPYFQMMLYLSDVDESSHCFSLSPEAIDDPVVDTEAQLQRGGIADLHGPAGTAILFNIAVLHTATVRPTERERKTVQVYYGPPEARYLSNDSLIPPRLWRDAPDPATRAFYGKLNPKSVLYSEAFGIDAPAQ